MIEELKLRSDQTQWNHCNHCKKNDHCRCCNNVIESFQCSVTYRRQKIFQGGWGQRFRGTTKKKTEK